MTNACKIHGPLGVLHCICRDLEREAAQRQATATRIADLESRLALAERDRDEKDRQLDEALGQCVALGLDLEGTMRERDSLRVHYDAVREQVIVVTERLAAARVALEKIREATNLALPSEQTGPEWEQCVRVPLARLDAIDVAVASVLGEAAVTNEPKPALHAAPCASCGQDPAGGHNLGCPDGTGLGNE